MEKQLANHRNSSLAQTFQDFALGKITSGHMQSEINRFTLYVLLHCVSIN